MKQQPKGATAKKLNKRKQRAKTNHTKNLKLSLKLRRAKAVYKNKLFNWFLKHGKKEEENAD